MTCDLSISKNWIRIFSKNIFDPIVVIIIVFFILLLNISVFNNGKITFNIEIL